MSMSNLYQTPSFHHLSSLSRSRSNSLSSVRRSSSYTATSAGGFTLPSYGYGGGYMSRSLSRSNSSLFGRSLSSTALNHTPPMHNVGVQRSTPHYSDKFPYVRYSYGNTDTSLALKSQTDLTSRNYPTVKDTGTRRWLEGKLNAFNPGLFSRHSVDYFSTRVERPVAPTRDYTRYMGVNDAVDLYKKKCMTVSTLSKYWLSPTTSQSRRERDLSSGGLSSLSSYSYPSRYDGTSSKYYSKVASRLGSSYVSSYR